MTDRKKFVLWLIACVIAVAAMEWLAFKWAFFPGIEL
jgi:hypothetical protein